jgi:hypothetical protein
MDASRMTGRVEVSLGPKNHRPTNKNTERTTPDFAVRLSVFFFLLLCCGGCGGRLVSKCRRSLASLEDARSKMSLTTQSTMRLTMPPLPLLVL